MVLREPSAVAHLAQFEKPRPFRSVLLRRSLDERKPPVVVFVVRDAHSESRPVAGTAFPGNSHGGYGNLRRPFRIEKHAVVYACRLDAVFSGVELPCDRASVPGCTVHRHRSGPENRRRHSHRRQYGTGGETSRIQASVAIRRNLLHLTTTESPYTLLTSITYSE